MFRALVCPSSGDHDCFVDYHIGRFILGLLSRVPDDGHSNARNMLSL